MASPIAIVGSRINHLRRRADLKYSLILRGLNSTLIRVLLSPTNFSLSHLSTNYRSNLNVDQTEVCRTFVTAWPEFCAPRRLPENSLSRSSAGHSGFRGALPACHQWRPVPRPNGNDK